MRVHSERGFQMLHARRGSRGTEGRGCQTYTLKVNLLKVVRLSPLCELSSLSLHFSSRTSARARVAHLARLIPRAGAMILSHWLSSHAGGGLSLPPSPSPCPSLLLSRNLGIRREAKSKQVNE